jgi:hypothetical protein
MEQIWNKLLTELCKAQHVCVNGEPNWLGWVLLSSLGVVAIFFILFIVAFIVAALMSIFGTRY